MMQVRRLAIMARAGMCGLALLAAPMMLRAQDSEGEGADFQPELAQEDGAATIMPGAPASGWQPSAITGPPEDIAKAAVEVAPIWQGYPVADGPSSQGVYDEETGVRGTPKVGDAGFSATLMQAGAQARQQSGNVGASLWPVQVDADMAASVAIRPAANHPVAIRKALEQLDAITRLMAEHKADLTLARTAQDVQAAMRQERMAYLPGIEGASAIGGSLAVLRQFYALGIRYMALGYHSGAVPKASLATDQATARNAADTGKEGRDHFAQMAVQEMNRIGMVADMSHAEDAIIQAVFGVARAPLIFSHAGARAVSAHQHNVPDYLLDRLAANGGVVMIAANPAQLSELYRQWEARLAGERARLALLHPGEEQMMAANLREWRRSNPEPVLTPGDIADHVEHIARRIGVEHVGIGGNYEGAFADGHLAVFTELAQRGFAQAELEMIASGNMMRVLRSVEDHAAHQDGERPVEAPMVALSPHG